MSSTLGTITTADANPRYAGIQVAVVGGTLSFQVPLPLTTGTATVTAQEVTGKASATGSATYTVAPKIGVRGDLGLGLLAFTGIQDMGNPFTENGAGTSGALAMFALRVAVSGDYAITPNIVATVTPLAFSYSPAKSGLRADISAITRLDFMLGIGYRM